MKKIMFASALALAATAATAADSLENVSFESSNVTAGSYRYVGTGLSADNWVFTGATGISSNATAWGGSASDGNFFAFIQDYPPSLSFTPTGVNSISQTFTLSSAADLNFSFDLARRAYSVGAGAQAVVVTLDGISLGTYQPANTSWSTFTAASLGVSAGSHTLSFTGNDTDVGDHSVFLDNVSMSVAAVPEPSTTAMLLAGLGMMGMIVRRRVRI